MSYKLHLDLDGITYNIQRLGNNPCSFGRNSDNIDYRRFLKDVKEQGLSIVEGPDVLVEEDYAVARKKAYGPIEDQLDKIYHKGLDVWKSDILAIKDAIPRTQERTTSVGPVPDWVQTEADAYTP
jgi:hypothetical protein